MMIFMVTRVYKKVKIEKEAKLKEFNFKLLHGILPCNKNVEKWKIRCDVCGSSQTIDNLLYNCNHVRPLWRIVERKLGITFSFEQILVLEIHYLNMIPLQPL